MNNYKINRFYKNRIQYLFFFILFSTSIYSQELPPIDIYTPNDYNAGNQNWMISQASNNFIYIANNEGLLEFNGAKWKLYSTPNKTIMRSVKVIDDLIYTGCFMEFGFWKKNITGVLEYFSLADKLVGNMVEDEQIWDIINFEHWVLFQSFNRIYIYNTLDEQFTIIEAKNQIQKIVKIKSKIYYYEYNVGLFQITEGKPFLYIKDTFIDENKIMNIFNYDNNILFLTQKKGFYFYSDGKFKKWKIKADILLNAVSIYSSIKLQDGSFGIGTISNGIIYLSDKGEITHQVSQNNGLSNNTVLSQFVDRDKNLWLGLDNGVNILNLESPITLFKDYNGVLGTTYCSKIYDGNLYLGTNQGLFYKKNNSIEKFKLYKGTRGQVWSLNIFDSSLFCGHDQGTFVINRSSAKLLKTSIGGTWDIKKIPNDSELLLQGTYDGFYVLKKVDGEWELRNKVEGFNISARFFEYISSNKLIINHEYKGLYKLSIDKEYSKVTKFHLDSVISKGKNSSVIAYKNKILYINEDGVFTYSEKEFIKDTILSQLINQDNYISGKSIVDQDSNLWLFSKKNILHITPNQLVNNPKINSIPISEELRKGKKGFENISQLSKNKHLVGTSNGYLKLDLSKIKIKTYEVLINNVYFLDIREQKRNLSLGGNKKNLKNNQNDVGFDFSVAEYSKNLIPEYQYQLAGLDSKWSSFSTNSEVAYSNLKYGTYTFELRAKVGNSITKVKQYTFRIDKPWYLSSPFILLYVLLTILLTIIIHKTYKWYYKRQFNHNLIKKEQLITNIKNEQLGQDIESKNRELAISTMSLIKKNEALSKVKNELIAMDEVNNKSVIKLIDRNLNSKKDWEFFEQAFNNADKNFLSNIKKAYPNLTPNDLRFCAYLRLNITSKELAPLLNISYRSVEIKRYRLRKKMNLASDKSLIKHILDF